LACGSAATVARPTLLARLRGLFLGNPRLPAALRPYLRELGRLWSLLSFSIFWCLRELFLGNLLRLDALHGGVGDGRKLFS